MLATATDNVIVTLDVTTGITISDGANVTMAPTLGVTADQSIGTSSWIVKTNAALGYTWQVKASAAPALVSGANSFADFTEAVSGTPEVWSVAGGAKEFGYSAFGTDTAYCHMGNISILRCGWNTGVAQNYVGFSR